MKVSSELAAYALEVAKVPDDAALRLRFIEEFGSYVVGIRAAAAGPPLPSTPHIPVDGVRKRLGRLSKALATIEADLADAGEVFGFFAGNGLARSLKNGASEPAWARVAKFWPEQKSAFMADVMEWRAAVEFLRSEIQGRSGAPPDPTTRSDLQNMVAGAAFNLVADHSIAKPTTTPGGPYRALAELIGQEALGSSEGLDHVAVQVHRARRNTRTRP